MQSAVALLTDDRFDWSTRLLRLSGWRGADLEDAARAGGRLRLAPAFCAVAAIGLGLLGSPVLLALLAATAAIGAVAGNHPIEMLHNALAGPGRVRIPRARAARASGCLMGAVMLAGSAVAFGLGAPTLGLVLALALGGLAAFVAATAICVPSIVFTTLFGRTRASAPSLRAALSRTA